MQADSQQISPSEIAPLLERLHDAPRRFADAIAMSEGDTLAWFGSEEQWSPQAILAHVRTSHAIIQPRIYYMLVRDNPRLEAYDDGAWRAISLLDKVASTDSVTALRLNREELVRMLRSLPAEAWLRTGIHEIAGPVTVYSVALALADHDDEHIAQLENTIRSGAL